MAVSILTIRRNHFIAKKSVNLFGAYDQELRFSHDVFWGSLWNDTSRKKSKTVARLLELLLCHRTVKSTTIWLSDYS